MSELANGGWLVHAPGDRERPPHSFAVSLDGHQARVYLNVTVHADLKAVVVSMSRLCFDDYLQKASIYVY